MYRISEDEYRNLPQECRGMLENQHTILVQHKEFVEGTHFVFVPDSQKHIKLQACAACQEPSIIYSRNLCHACYERVRRQRMDETWEEKIEEQRLQAEKRRELAASANHETPPYPLNILPSLRMLGDGLPDRPDAWYQTALPQAIDTRLNDVHRDVIKMRFQSNMSIRDIGRYRGCSRQNVYSLLTGALCSLYHVITGRTPGSFDAISLPSKYMDYPVSCLDVNQKMLQKLEDAGMHTLRQVLNLVNHYRYSRRRKPGFRSSTIHKYRIALKELSASGAIPDDGRAPAQPQKTYVRSGTPSPDNSHQNRI